MCACFFCTMLTGLDVTICEVVEIAALVATTGSRFATVVRPTLLQEAELATAVHGIGSDEMHRSPSFSVAFKRFVEFLQHAADTALAEPENSDDEEDGDPEALPILQCPAPTVVLCGHNGFKYDGPVLVYECARHGVPVCWLNQFKWLDTLHVIQACRFAPCSKLQCLIQGAGANESLHAHRALDDVLALDAVMRNVADMFAVPLADLLRPFVVDFDALRTLVDLSACC